MRVTLVTQSGPSSPRKIWVVSGRATTVGRSEESDHALAKDVQMSALHFRVECDVSECRIRDIQSSNGTFVNGRRINEAVLRDGDLVVAGQTTFRVHIEDQIKETSSAGQLAKERMADARQPDISLATPNEPAGSRAMHYAQPHAPPPLPSQRAAISQPASLDRLAVPLQSLRVSLEVRSGTSKGHRIWMRPDQKIEVGRNAMADLSIPDDTRMSFWHFSLELGQTSCVIQDIGSSNGTLLNGEPVRDAIVHDGDQILAGQTQFEIHLESTSATKRAQPAGRGSYRMRRCPSGVMLFQESENAPRPAEFVRILTEIAPLHLIVDLRKVVVQVPLNTVHLLNWVPQPITARLSPVFLPPSDHLDLYSIVEQAWGKDALCSVYSKLEPPGLLAHLRLTARGQHRATAVPVPKHMFGSCHPSTLQRVIAECKPQFARFLFSRIHAILLESDQGWSLLAENNFSILLEQLGLACDV